MHSFKFSAIGTQWQIDINQQISSGSIKKIEKVIFKRIEEFDKNYSRFRNDSWVIKNSYKQTSSTVPVDFKPLFDLYKRLNYSSKGLFTPLIGEVMEKAGYDRNYSLKPKKLTSPPLLDTALSFKEGRLDLKKGVLLDFGAAGKGYLIDVIGQLLKEMGIFDFYIDGSGDILYQNKKNEPIRVGLEHPDNPSLVIGVCNLLNQSICASAGNRRKWDKFHHTINPITLTSPDEIKATWVIANNALLADALATCLYLDPDVTHYKDYKFDCVLLYKDNTAFVTNNFQGEIFT